MIRFFTAGLILALVLVASSSAMAQNDPIENILAGLESRYANQAFAADFEQTTHLNALDMTETASGKAWFSYPGKMRWAYAEPDHHEIITDGQTIWIYRPQEKQVMQGSAAQFFAAGAGGAFLSDITQIRKNFSIALGRAQEDSTELVLTPKKQSQDLDQIRITLDPNRYDILSVITRNPYGDTTRFVFTHIKFYDPDPSLFSFTVPDNTSVIEMN